VLGAKQTLLADSGYFSENNVTLCREAGIEPLIPPGRQDTNCQIKGYSRIWFRLPDDANNMVSALGDELAIRFPLIRWRVN